MAERRMFAKKVIESDLFIEMPISARLLYYELGMRADDDGFVGNPNMIIRIIGASVDDIKILCGKGFIIPFESGVVVIKHWKQNNFIRTDRYTKTRYQKEFSKLSISCDDAKAYELNVEKIPQMVDKGYTNGAPHDNQTVDDRETQYSIGKSRIGKDSIDNISCSDFSDEKVENDTKVKKRKVIVFDQDSIPYKSAQYIARYILEDDSDYFHLRGDKYEKALQTWAKDIDLMLRRDSVTESELKEVLVFCRSSEFWRMNIKSGSKLREKFGELLHRARVSDE